MKKTLAFAFCLLGILGLSGCGSQSSVGVVANAEEEATITLRFAYASNSQPVIDAMNKFGELVEEKTAGSVKVKYFPDGQLGENVN